MSADAPAGPPDGPAPEGGSLTDVLLAMDVVDTLRRREQLALDELDGAGREEALLTRLKEIYAAQGMDVPDRILREGVAALAERRFVYEPPEPSVAVSLAKLYVARDRWWKPVAGGAAALVVAGGAYQFGYAAPAEARRAAVQVELAETLPAALIAERDAVLETTDEETARRLVETLYQDGAAALADADARAARAAVEDLQVLKADLAAAYDVTVISRPGELSGVFRIPDDVPGARNYYLIVQAIDARGRALEVPITSEEDRRSARVTTWGQRVSEAAFNAVAADKGDDQIIQNAVIGRKRPGRLAPEFDVETPGGTILEW